MSRFLFLAEDSEAATEQDTKKQNGNPEGVALDSRSLATVDAGCASSWGWGKTGDQGESGRCVIPCHDGKLLFSRWFREEPATRTSCRPILRKKIAISVAIEDQFRFRLRFLRLGWESHHQGGPALVRAVNHYHRGALFQFLDAILAWRKRQSAGHEFKGNVHNHGLLRLDDLSRYRQGEKQETCHYESAPFHGTLLFPLGQLVLQPTAFFFAPGAPESVMRCAHFRALLLEAQCTGDELKGVFRWTTKCQKTGDLVRWTRPGRVFPEPCYIRAMRRGSYVDAW